MKLGLKIFGGVVAFLILLVGLQFFGLEWMKYFGVKRQDVRREVFEESKSYVHGKIQDLSKYFAEYSEGTEEEKLAIQSLIQMQFAEFDETNIRNKKLKRFLINIRGF